MNMEFNIIREKYELSGGNRNFVPVREAVIRFDVLSALGYRVHPIKAG